MNVRQVAKNRKLAVLGTLALIGTAQAALVDRGGGLIYDAARNITWLADMNYAATSGYAAANAGGAGSTQVLADGRMGWDAAQAWANSLVYGGYDDWRLPMLNPSDTGCGFSFDPGGGYPLQFFGYHCTDSELSGLFGIELGNKAQESVLDQTGDSADQIANLALFSHVQSAIYWSGSPFAPDPSFASWGFLSNDGFQSANNKITLSYAVAVRRGDVIAPVPEPQTLTLALLALGATCLVRRRVQGR